MHVTWNCLTCSNNSIKDFLTSGVCSRSVFSRWFSKSVVFSFALEIFSVNSVKFQKLNLHWNFLWKKRRKEIDKRLKSMEISVSKKSSYSKPVILVWISNWSTSCFFFFFFFFLFLVSGTGMTSGVDRPKAQRHSWRIFAGNLGAGGFSGSGSRIKYFSNSYIILE